MKNEIFTSELRKMMKGETDHAFNGHRKVDDKNFSDEL